MASVRSVVLNPCGREIARSVWPICSNLVCTLNMEKGRHLFIYKVKDQISKPLGLYKEFWHLDPCGQDIARTMLSRLLKLSMYTSYGKREAYLFSMFKVKFQGH